MSPYSLSGYSNIIILYIATIVIILRNISSVQYIESAAGHLRLTASMCATLRRGPNPIPSSPSSSKSKMVEHLQPLRMTASGMVVRPPKGFDLSNASVTTLVEISFYMDVTMSVFSNCQLCGKSSLLSSWRVLF